METHPKKGHPKGLKFLFLTEMWERFGYYLMLGIFSLYLMDAKGMGLNRVDAYDIVGTYLGLVFLTPFLGGLIADRILGYRKSIIIGAIFMAAGYFTLAINEMTALWIGLLLIIIGNGFLKPNISTLLGNLYNKEEYKDKKDSGYSIFYMGINVGAFICNFVAAYMRNRFGWGFAFAAAGTGLILGLIFFIWGTRHLKEADKITKEPGANKGVQSALLYVFIPAIICGALAWFIPGNIFGTNANDAFIFGCIPVVIFYISLIFRSPKNERSQIKALLSIFLIMIVFWTISRQSATVLNTFTERNVERRVEYPKVVNAFNSLGMIEDVTYKKDSVMHLDNRMTVITDSYGIAMRTFDYPNYFKNSKNIPSEESTIHLVSTEIFQSINPLFVLIFMPLILAFFAYLRRRKKEPSTPGKMGIGLFITGLSTLVMMWAVYSTDIFTDKVSALWMICTYAVITIGELMISPIGLSLVSKMSPKNITSFMMGGWFFATAIGNKLSGIIAGLWNSFDNKANYFLMNFAICVGAAIIILVLLKWLRRIINQHT